MSKGRLEAFSDGVIAILITIMVLALTVPREATLAALRPLIPTFLSYALSFVFLGIYWNNHHHLFQATKRVDGRVLWANMHLLFWLSLVPFATAWMGENDFAHWPVALYGVVLLFAAMAYFILVRALIALHGSDSTLAKIPVIIFTAGDLTEEQHTRLAEFSKMMLHKSSFKEDELLGNLDSLLSKMKAD